MKRLEVRDVEGRVNTPLDRGEPLIVEQHERAIRAYVPFQVVDNAAVEQAANELAETLNAIYTRTGMSEDELVAAFL